LPGGSKITVKNNLFILTKDANDTRNIFQGGMDVRTINGSGIVVFDISNNWSTNDNLTSGQVFTSGAFNAKNNSAGKWPEMIISGVGAAVVTPDNISATDLMNDPNPHNYEQGEAIKRHHHDSYTGLYYKNTEAVKNSNIYKLGIGASTWEK
jgi:hypothetical protein